MQKLLHGPCPLTSSVGLPWIFDVVVSHLGLSVGKEDELTPEHRQDDTRPGAGRVDSTQIRIG